MGGKPVTAGVSLPGSAVAGIALAGEGLVFVQAPTARSDAGAPESSVTREVHLSAGMVPGLKLS